ncbi:MAG: PTS sugar transporter subunit IIA [Treponema sp.]|jgi:mannitol/fructose-specific phosphotransferase system IIA component (Ntr-type)|nr:PTS sugar transporter subunit IIA [Treponema sp.]
MQLTRVFDPRAVIPDLRGDDKNEILEELIERLAEVHTGIHHDEALEAIMKREAKMSTGIIHRVAIPHALCASAADTVGAIGICRRGVDFGSLDTVPVQLIFLLLTYPKGYEESLDVLMRLSCLLEDSGFIDALLEGDSPRAAGETLAFYERKLALPLCS